MPRELSLRKFKIWEIVENGLKLKLPPPDQSAIQGSLIWFKASFTEQQHDQIKTLAFIQDRVGQDICRAYLRRTQFFGFKTPQIVRLSYLTPNRTESAIDFDFRAR